MSKIVIREEVPADIRAVTRLLYEAWLETYPNETLGITRDDIENRFKHWFDEKELANRAKKLEDDPGRYTFVAEKDNEIVGVCGVEVGATKQRLAQIYVAPNLQGQGIGKQLYAVAQEHFTPGVPVHVCVASYNQQAINFYERLGFKRTGKEFTDPRLIMKSGATIPEIELIHTLDEN